MNASINQPIRDIWQIPTTKAPSIYQFDFNDRECAATFDNGFPWEFSSTRLPMIVGFSAAYKTRFTATNPASTSFQIQDENDIWGSTLRGVGVANFNGPWNHKLLGYYLSKMPELDILSCTYWSCYDIAYVIEQISSTKLRELTLHVGAGQGMEVIEAIAGRRHPELKRILLIFTSEYNKPKVDSFLESLKPVLAENAELILLFASEGECIQDLESKFEYNAYGTMKMAVNELVQDFDAKTFEQYSVYESQDGGRKVLIGCRRGVFAIPPVMPKCLSEEIMYENEEKIMLIKSTSESPHVHPQKTTIPSWQYQNKKNMNAYSTINKMTGERSCCTGFPEVQVDCHIRKFRVAGWLTTKVQVVIYQEDSTEFLTTNGLYIRLQKMEDEAEFFKSMPATKRLVFKSASHLRLNIVDENLMELLSDVEHIEFKGDFDSRVLGRIAAQLTPTTTAMTFVQISFQPGDPFRQILDNVHFEVLKGIRRLHYDARDSYDHDFNSCYNGMKDKFMAGSIEELVVVTGKIGVAKFATNLNKLYQDICGLVVPTGCVTIVVTEQNIAPSDMKDEGFEGSASVTLIPLAYQQNSSFGPSRMRAMLGLYSQKYERERFLVVKWADVLMLKHFPDMQKFDQEKFNTPRDF